MSKQTDRAWSDFSERFRREEVPKIASSAVTLSMIRTSRDIDVEQATNLGAVLLLGTPLILVCVPGAPVPYRLRRAADVVIEDWTPDNQPAQDRVEAALRALSEQPEGTP